MAFFMGPLHQVSALCLFPLLGVEAARADLKTFDIHNPEAKTTPWHPH